MLKEGLFLRCQEKCSDALGQLQSALEQPCLYDDALLRLSAQGLRIPPEVLDRGVTQPYEPSIAVEEAWLAVYRDTARYWELYQLAEKLVDLDDALLTWRHKHVLTVERIIGGKRGTGGTEGVSYLQSTLQRRCFPELWSLRTRL